MNKMMIKGLFMLLACALVVHAIEIAVTNSGKKVVLKNDGTWETYDPARHLQGIDLREAPPPVEIALKFRDYKWCMKERRMLLEADEIPEAAILDSLKKIPAGGEVIVQIPTAHVNLKDPRVFQYKVIDSKGKVLLQTEASESTGQPADEANLTNLIVLALPAGAKGDLTIQIRNKASQELFEYTIERETP